MTTKTDTRHPFGELLAQYRARKPGLTQTRLAELAGYNQAILVRMAQGKKDLTGPSGRERVVRLIETLADQGALTTLDEANALLLAADMPPLFERQLNEARLITRLSRLPVGQRVRRTNLPAPLTSFVGRAQEIAEVRRLLGLTRLLTLTGAGGCGKTRLAQRIAADVLITYSEGVWYAELAALSDSALIPDVVARALGLIAVDRPAQEQVLDFLRERQVLLVLDNCEHLVDAVAAFSIEVLQACPRATILTTSREALNVDGETAWRVPPMQPDEAGRLFVDRAAAARSDVTLSAQDQTVAHICQRLDGMPLAIELAAARLSALSLSDIAARLEDRFALLSNGRRGALPRHQTLRALMDWSYDSLSELEKIVFRRLGVFVGGWELEQAEDIVCDEQLPRSKVLPLLSQLVSKSLVVMESNDGMTRYRPLETVREYMCERLHEYDERDHLNRRHAAAFAGLSERSIPHLRGGGQKEWVKRLNQDASNLREALNWSFAEEGDAVFGVRTVAALMYLWDLSSSHFKEARRWYAQAMRALNDVMPTKVRADVLMAVCYSGAIYELSILIEHSQTSLALYQEINDKSGIAFALCFLSDIQFKFGLLDAAQTLALLTQAVALAQDAGDDWVIRFGLGLVGFLAYAQKDIERTIDLTEELAQKCREAGDEHRLGIALLILIQCWLDQLRFDKAHDCAEEARVLAYEVGDEGNDLEARLRLAQVTYYLGDLQNAQSMLEECLLLAQRFGYSISITKGYLARVLNAAGDHKRALELLTEAFVIFRRSSDAPNDHDHHTGEYMDFFACIAANRGDMQRAGRLFGAGEAIYIAIKFARLARHEWEFAPYIAKARAALGDAAYEAAYAEGRAMTLEQAIAYALQAT